MAIAALPTRPYRGASQEALHPCEELAVALSTASSALDDQDAEQVIADAVEDIGQMFAAEECTLLSFDHATVHVVSSWAAHPYPPATNDEIAAMPWLVQRLSRNAVVAVSSAATLPFAAAKDREQDERSGIAARLAVPVALGSRVLYGLMLATRQPVAKWDDATIDRLRLLGEILGAGLLRRQQDDALKSRRDTSAWHKADPKVEKEYPKAPLPSPTESETIVGQSAPLRMAMAQVAQVASTDTTVLLLGETGTGKELFARAIHDRSRRRDRTLIRVNCAALPATLIESELFGHERGAFTGAISMRQGRFELADGGTIFLDEIGDLAPELQAKLLRVLQEGEFERVGSSKTQRIDVRVIAGTHVDLKRAVDEGRFRADLYYRLSVFPITLPPLRERPDDIPQLVWFFINRRQRELGRRFTDVPQAVIDALKGHDWPGNVRELENVIERAMIRSTGGTLHLDDPLASGTRPQTPTSCDMLDAVQRMHIERVLKECGWRINGVGAAAVRLGVHPNTLRFRIRKLGIAIPGRRTAMASPSSEARRE